MPSNNTWTRVIVLTPPLPGGELPDWLRAEFAARDWFAIVHSDPCLAMAELCLREKSQIARAAWGLQRMEHIALAIVHTDDSLHHANHADAIDDLITAIRKYVCNASVWEIVGDAINLMHAGSVRNANSPTAKTAASGARANAQPNPAAAPPHQPQLRLTGELAIEDSDPGKTQFPAPQTIVDVPHDSNAAESLPHLDESHDAESSTRLTRAEIEMLLDLNSPILESEAAS